MTPRQRLVGTVAGTLLAAAGLVFAVLGISYAYTGLREPDVGSLLLGLGAVTAVIGLALLGAGGAVVVWSRRKRS